LQDATVQLADATVAIRPRNAWEALDLGVRLARRHAGLLMSSWALLTLPVFLLLSAVLWTHPSLAVCLFWLCKPAYERLTLFILSRALFGQTPTMQEAFRALPGLLRPQLLASLTWRRLAARRSFALPVLQLEQLSGQPRRERLAVLGQRDARPAMWLTLVGAHLEAALCLGVFSLAYLMIPEPLASELNWRRLIDASSGDWLWLDHLSNLVYALVLVVWEPVYVACGFMLYLNRRTELEAWDVELAFRRLRQRIAGVAASLLLAGGLLLAFPATEARAAPSASCQVPVQDPLGPEAPRLLHQALASQAAREAIQAELARPPFTNQERVTRWRLGTERDGDAPGAHTRLPDWLRRWLDTLLSQSRLAWLPKLLEVLLWGLLAAALALAIVHGRHWLALFGPRRQARSASREPKQLFGLELSPESLPDDVAGQAERLWNSQPREALGLLYRALLSRLVHDHRLPLKDSHTETEVLQLAENLYRDELTAYATALTRHWQALAYGHRLPPEQARADLCQGWRSLFGATR
jgi:hypothetical protein